MAKARVRRARTGDAASILALESLFPSDRMSPRSVRHFLRTPTACVWVAEHRGRVLGNLVLLLRRGARHARIYSVIVDPEARGLGIGHRLVETAEREARDQGLSGVALEVRADNLAARSLYHSRGYVVTRELPGYYDDGTDGLRLLRVLQ